MGETVLYILLGVLGAELALIAPAYYGVRLLGKGDYQRAMPYCFWAHRLSRIIPGWGAGTALNLCTCYFFSGDFDAALPYAEKALYEANRSRNVVHLALAEASMGLLLLRKNEKQAAEAQFDSAVQRQIPPEARAIIALYAGGGYLHLGREAEAEALLKEAIEIEKAHLEVRPIAEANLIYCLHLQNRNAEALELARKTQTKHRYAHPLRDSTRLALDASYLACLVAAGEVQAAQEMEGRILAQQATAEPYLLSLPYRAIAELALRQGDLDRARSYAERAYPLDTRPFSAAHSLVIQAEVFAARRNQRRAADLCEEALRHADTPFLRARIARLVQSLRTTTPSAQVETAPETQQVYLQDGSF